MSYLLMHAELDAVVCSGPRRGKQFTYALLDERVPSAEAVDRRDALVELARRFFTSRGPATRHDFAKWSGLTLADARQGLEGAGRALACDVIDGRTYWFAIIATAHATRLRAMGGTLTATVIVNGRVVGTWKRRVERKAVVSHDLFEPLTKAEQAAVGSAERKFVEFLQN